MKNEKWTLSINYFIIFLYLLCVSFLNFTIGYIIPSILLIIFGFLIFLTKKHKLKTSYFVFQLFFILHTIIYIILGFTVSSQNSFSSLTTLFINIIINISIYYVINSCIKKENDYKKALEKIIKYFIPISIFVGVFILLYTKGAGEDGRLAHGILKPFSNSQAYISTEIALVALYGIISSLYFVYKNKEKKYLFALPFLFIIIVLTGSRKAILALLLIIFLYYFDFNNTKFNFKSLFKIIGGFLIIGILAFAIIKVPFLYDSIGWRFVSAINGEETSANSRSIMYELAQRKIKEKPLFGYGLNTFRTFNGSYGAWAHNNYYEILIAGGVFLFIPYYFFYFYIIKNLYKYRNRHPINKYFLYIMLVMIFCDFIGVTYMDRLVQFFLLCSSILVSQNRKDGNNNE